MLPDLQQFASAVNLFFSDEHRLLNILGFSSAAVLLQSVCECWSYDRESKFADWRAWGFVCGVVGVLSVYLLILLVQSRPHLLGGQLRWCYAVLSLWWANGVATLTFTDPFCLAGNGYFGTWASFACFAKLVALNVPFSCRAPPIPKLIVLFASVVAFVQSCVIRKKGSDHVCTANGVRSIVMNHGVRKADQGPSGLFDYSISYGVVGACVCLIDIIAYRLGFDKISVLCPFFSCAWWLQAVAIATCYQPFHYAGNGYFSCWFAWLACLVSSWQAMGPNRRHRLSVFLQTLVSPLELVVLILLSLVVVLMAIISCVETRSASDDRRGEVLVLILSISSAVVGAQLVAVWTSLLRARDFMAKLGTICLCLLWCVCSFVSLLLRPFRLFGNGFVVSAMSLVAAGLLAHRLLLKFGHQAAVDRVKGLVLNNKEIFSVYIASCLFSLQAVVDCLDRGSCDDSRDVALACGGGSVLLVASASVCKILGAKSGFIASACALAVWWLLGVAKFTFDKPYVYADVAYLSSWVASASSGFLVTKELRDYLDSQVRAFTAKSVEVDPEAPALAMPHTFGVLPQPEPQPVLIRNSSVDKKGWSLELVNDPKELNILGELLNVTDPENLGRGRDVRSKKNDYSNLLLAHAWKIVKPQREKAYDIAKTGLEIEIHHLEAEAGVTMPELKTKLDGVARKLFNIDESVNEKILLHGTKPENALSIIHNGLNEKLSKGIFGKGIYTAEDPSKIDQYCTIDPQLGGGTDLVDKLQRALYKNGASHAGDVFYCFVVKVALGFPIFTKDGNNNMSEPFQAIFETSSDQRELASIPNSNPPTPYHALIAEAGKGHKVARHREFVIFDSNRVMLEHILAYQRH